MHTNTADPHSPSDQHKHNDNEGRCRTPRQPAMLLNTMICNFNDTREARVPTALLSYTPTQDPVATCEPPPNSRVDEHGRVWAPRGQLFRYLVLRHGTDFDPNRCCCWHGGQQCQIVLEEWEWEQIACDFCFPYEENVLNDPGCECVCGCGSCDCGLCHQHAVDGALAA